MNSRKLALDLTQAFVSCYQQSQQQLEQDSDAREKLQQQIDELLTALDSDQDYRFIGQDLINQLFTMHPNISHLIPRDLLWLMGGPCLHYLSDDELEKYYQLDELQHQAEQQQQEFDWAVNKSRVFGSH